MATDEIAMSWICGCVGIDRIWCRLSCFSPSANSEQKWAAVTRAEFERHWCERRRENNSYFNIGWGRGPNGTIFYKHCLATNQCHTFQTNNTWMPWYSQQGLITQVGAFPSQGKLVAFWYTFDEPWKWMKMIAPCCHCMHLFRLF